MGEKFCIEISDYTYTLYLRIYFSSFSNFDRIAKYITFISSLVRVRSSERNVIRMVMDFFSVPNRASSSNIPVIFTSSMRSPETSRIALVIAKKCDSVSRVSSSSQDFSISLSSCIKDSLGAMKEISLNTGGKLLTSL